MRSPRKTRCVAVSTLLPLAGIAIVTPVIGVLGFAHLERLVRPRRELDLYAVSSTSIRRIVYARSRCPDLLGRAAVCCCGMTPRDRERGIGA
jgi:hypothetical protein